MGGPGGTPPKQLLPIPETHGKHPGVPKRKIFASPIPLSRRSKYLTTRADLPESKLTSRSSPTAGPSRSVPRPGGAASGRLSAHLAELALQVLDVPAEVAGGSLPCRG